jgi:SH3 domain protein
VFILSLAATCVAHADTAYVTDSLELAIRKEPRPHGSLLKSLPVGTALVVMDKKIKSGFAHVRLSDGTEGYILERYLQKEPPTTESLAANMTAASFKALQTENAALTTALKTAKDSITPGTSLEKSLQTERDRLSLELGELKKASVGVVQLKMERDELQERVVSAERELQQLKLENAALKDTSSQDWFLYGGILSFFSVILGFILPKLSWRRKNGWDSY